MFLLFCLHLRHSPTPTPFAPVVDSISAVRHWDRPVQNGIYFVSYLETYSGVKSTSFPVSDRFLGVFVPQFTNFLRSLLLSFFHRLYICHALPNAIISTAYPCEQFIALLSWPFPMKTILIATFPTRFSISCVSFKPSFPELYLQSVNKYSFDVCGSSAGISHHLLPELFSRFLSLQPLPLCSPLHTFQYSNNIAEF